MVMGNELIQDARYKLSAIQKNILTVLISEIARYDPSDQRYHIHSRAILKAIGWRSHSDFKFLEKQLKALGRARIVLKRDYVIYVSGFLMEHWLEPDRGWLKYTFNPDLKEYLFGLEGNFSMVRVDRVLKLNTFPAKRLYELIIKEASLRRKEYIPTINFTKTVSNLRMITGKDEKTHSQFHNFNRYVLEPSIDRINEEFRKAMEVSTKLNKIGREVVSVTFEGEIFDHKLLFPPSSTKGINHKKVMS
jgi:plasmid replication initiation protein